MTQSVSKVLGYALIGPTTSVQAVSKALGYALAGSPTNVMTTSKILAYALISVKGKARSQGYIF